MIRSIFYAISAVVVVLSLVVGCGFSKKNNSNNHYDRFIGLEGVWYAESITLEGETTNLTSDTSILLKIKGPQLEIVDMSGVREMCWNKMQNYERKENHIAVSAVDDCHASSANISSLNKNVLILSEGRLSNEIVFQLMKLTRTTDEYYIKTKDRLRKKIRNPDESSPKPAPK